ncbi:MAG: DNA/RNA non-specific endonuclease [Candidatus Kapabacteria bacterium]|nr:DNA/RNA non-specific endonuclease [Candidatus Kapabacteria bacterium]
MTQNRFVSLRRLAPIAILGIATALAIFLDSCGDSSSPVTPTAPRTARSIHTETGFPLDADTSDDYHIKRDQYEISYNPGLNVANWVAWNENASWYGPADRCDCFQPDTNLPKTFTLVTPGLYTSSGYDRSHILGSEARTRNADDNRFTFYMPNIFPQTPSMNQGTWASMERFADSLCNKANKELYVVAGGVYKTRNRIKNVVTIPDSCWKIIVVLERGQTVGAITASTPVYAAMMNNGTYTTATNDWRLYKTTVRAIEQSTGYSLLRDVPQSVQDIIETRVW